MRSGYLLSKGIDIPKASFPACKGQNVLSSAFRAGSGDGGRSESQNPVVFCATSNVRSVVEENKVAKKNTRKPHVHNRP